MIATDGLSTPKPPAHDVQRVDPVIEELMSQLAHVRLELEAAIVRADAAERRADAAAADAALVVGAALSFSLFRDVDRAYSAPVTVTRAASDADSFASLKRSLEEDDSLGSADEVLGTRDDPAAIDLGIDEAWFEARRRRPLIRARAAAAMATAGLVGGALAVLPLLQQYL